MEDDLVQRRRVVVPSLCYNRDLVLWAVIADGFDGLAPLVAEDLDVVRFKVTLIRMSFHETDWYLYKSLLLKVSMIDVEELYVQPGVPNGACYTARGADWSGCSRTEPVSLEVDSWSNDAKEVYTSQ